MKRIENDMDIITSLLAVNGKSIIDVGCGTGDLVRKLTEAGAIVSGIDTADMIMKANEFPTAGNETYLEGGGEALPLPGVSADVILFIASFHHVPETQMDHALAEARRVLKPGGIAVIVEPVATPGSYTELIRLVEDEELIQKLALEAINRAADSVFMLETEEKFYFERSLQDYQELLEKYVEEEDKRVRCFFEAQQLMERMSLDSGVNADAYRFKSICRRLVLTVPSSK